MKLAIVVCTCNRSLSLAETLAHLAIQQHSGLELQVLVIDNNSIDDTPGVVRQAQLQSPIDIVYRFEPRQGLSHARNRAIIDSDAEVLLFIDDDAYPVDAAWALRMAAVFADESIGAAGGDALAEWPAGGRPEWLHDHLLGYIGVTRFNYDRLTDLYYPHFPFGVNIAFRRQLLVDLGGFSTALGRQGAVLLSGEETALCLGVSGRGYRVVYVPDVPVYHRMAPERLTPAWFLTRARYQGISKAVLEQCYDGMPGAGVRVVKRIFVLCAAITLWLLAAAAGMSDTAMRGRCTTAMSLAYLLHQFGLIRLYRKKS